jgi:TolB protein
MGYCWRPDGEALLYSYYDKLYKVNKNGTGLVPISTAPAGMNFLDCDWNDHTHKIIVQATKQKIYESEFYIMDESGNNVQLFAEDSPGRMDSPSFYIDGSKVLFTFDAEGFNSVDGRQLDAQIVTVSIDNTDTTYLSEGKQPGTNDLLPRYSPDGAWIIFLNESNTGLGPTNIWVMDSEGGGRSPIIEDATTPFWGVTDN